jgi:hypothetical protein
MFHSIRACYGHLFASLCRFLQCEQCLLSQKLLLLPVSGELQFSIVIYRKGGYCMLFSFSCIHLQSITKTLLIVENSTQNWSAPPQPADSNKMDMYEQLLAHTFPACTDPRRTILMNG